MTKLKLNQVQQTGEILTREELKGVLGGIGSDVDSGSGSRCYNSYTHCNVDGENDGNCETNSKNKCVCNNGSRSIISSMCVK